MSKLGNPLVYELLALARELARPGASHAARTSRRRAISTAYYAAFHAICFVITDELIGWGSNDRLVRPIFRLLDHRDLDKISRDTSTPIKKVGDALKGLREERLDADYLPPIYRPNVHQAREVVQLAGEVVEMIEALSSDDRRELAVLLIAKRR